MPHRSNPRSARLRLDGLRPSTHLRRRSTPPTSCRSTYGRMPPCRNAASSSGVSMRASALKRTGAPSGRRASTAISPRAAGRSAMPVTRERLLGPSGRGSPRSRPPRNCSGSTPMFTRLLRWMRSKLSAMTAFTPSSSVPFAAQSRDEPEPYSLPGEDEQRHALLLVAHRRVVDRHLLAVGQVTRPAAFGAGRQLVAQADVGERAAHHHLVVAAARAVGVEVARLDAVRDQVLARPGCPAGSSRPARCGRS